MTQVKAQAMQLNDVPEGWKVVKVDQISKVRRGASPRPIRDTSYFSDSGRGWIRIKDVTSAYKHLKKTSQCLSARGEAKSVKVNPGNLIMSICATVGKPVIVDIPACIHDGFVWFSELSNEVDTEFLFYALQLKEQEFVNKKQTGTQGNLNTNIVGSTEIPLPPIEEQKRITSILSTADNSIQQSNTIIKKVQQFKKGVIHHLLTRGIGHTTFKKTDIGEVPEGWKIDRIGNLVLPIKSAIKPGPFGTQLKTSDITTSGFRVYGQDNVIANNFYIGNRYISRRKYQDLKNSTLSPGDVLVTRIGTLGFAAVFPDDAQMGIMDSNLLRILIDKKEIKPELLVILFRDSTIIKRQLVKNTQKAVQTNLNSKILGSFLIPIPPLLEQDKIASIIANVDKKILLAKNIRDESIKIRTGLAKELLKGKVRVKVP